MRSSPSGTKTGSKPKPSVPDAARAIAPSSAPRATTSRPSSETATITQTYRARRSSSSTSASSMRPTGSPAAHRARQHARAPVERDGLDPRVLPDRPGRGGRVRRAPARLDPRVVLVRRAVLARRIPRVGERDLPARERAPQLCELVRVPRCEDERAARGHAAQSGGAAHAVCWAAPSAVIPPAARSSSSSSSSRENGSRSAVAWTSTRRPSPAITTFMSVSADESST